MSNTEPSIYYLSLINKIGFGCFSVFISSVLFGISNNDIVKWILGVVVIVVLNLPLYFFQIDLYSDHLVINWKFKKIDIPFSSIIFVGKMYNYKDHLIRKTFSYGLVYKTEGEEKIISFPKTQKIKEMTDFIYQSNNLIEVKLQL